MMLFSARIARKEYALNEMLKKDLHQICTKWSDPTKRVSTREGRRLMRILTRKAG